MSSDLKNEDSDAEEPKKSSRRILQHELAEARQALERSALRLLLSGLSAGLDLGFSLFLMALVITIAHKGSALPLQELLVSSMYAFGFIIVVIGRSELFTEQTSLAVMPLLSRQTTLKSVARLWSLVYVSNLAGGTVAAFLIVKTGTALKVIDPAVFGMIAKKVVNHEWWVIFLSAILAGWLMGLLSWLVAAGRDTISQIVIVWMITSAIGLGHLHHCILGTIEVLGGIIATGNISLAESGRFLLWATLGNAVGGPLFVALLRHGQGRPPSTSFSGAGGDDD